MIRARHHPVIYPFFKWLSLWLIRHRFNSVRIQGEFNDTGTAVLVIANHISWWDGFWIMMLNIRIIKKKFHFMMLEEQLKKHWYFQYTGGYSVRKKSRSVMESIEYTRMLLNTKENMVLLFPQGKIHSLYDSQVVFEQGIERILSGVPSDTQVLLVANLVDYLADVRPNLFVYIQPCTVADFSNSPIETAYNRFYQEVLELQKGRVC